MTSTQVMAPAAQLKADGTGAGVAAGGEGVGVGVGVEGLVVAGEVDGDGTGVEDGAGWRFSARSVAAPSPPPPQAVSVAKTRVAVRDMRKLLSNVSLFVRDAFIMIEFVLLWEALRQRCAIKCSLVAHRPEGPTVLVDGNSCLLVCATVPDEPYARQAG